MFCLICGNDKFHVTNLETDLPVKDWHINPNTLKKIVRDSALCTKCGNTFSVVHCANYDISAPPIR